MSIFSSIMFNFVISIQCEILTNS